MSKPCSQGFHQCQMFGCIQTLFDLNKGKCERYMLKLIDVKLRVSQGPVMGHYWDGIRFRRALPVALCGGTVLYPRDPTKFMTSEEMKQVPFCQKCLSLVKN